MPRIIGSEVCCFFQGADRRLKLFYRHPAVTHTACVNERRFNAIRILFGENFACVHLVRCTVLCIGAEQHTFSKIETSGNRHRFLSPLKPAGPSSESLSPGMEPLRNPQTAKYHSK